MHVAQRVGSVLGCLGLLVLCGCPFQDTRTTNQGGGNLVTAGVKVEQQRLASLSADEIQILADTAAGLVEGFDYELSDDEAEVIRQFLVQNDLNGPGDIQALIDEVQGAEDPTSVLEIPDGAMELLQSLSAVFQLDQNFSDVLGQLRTVPPPPRGPRRW